MAGTYSLSVISRQDQGDVVEADEQVYVVLEYMQILF